MVIPTAVAAQRKQQLLELAKEAMDLKGAIDARRLIESDVLERRRQEQQKAEIDRQLNGYYLELESLEKQPDNSPVSPEILQQGQAEQQKLADLRQQMLKEPESPHTDQSSRVQKTRHLRVFICWVRANRTLAEELHEKLRKDGVHSWWDIEPGQQRSVEQPRALRASDILLVLVSRAALVPSGDLNQTVTGLLNLAEKQTTGNLTTISLLLDETELPERLADHYALDYSGLDHYPALRQVLANHASRLRLESPLSSYSGSPVSGGLATPGQLIAERYRLVRVLGSGAFGEVFEAQDTKFKPPRVVAIKLLLRQFLAERQVREELEQEASLMARFNHPNILRVIDFDLSPNLAYIVTELAEGGTLADKLAAGSPLPPAEIAAYLDQLASALDEAHSQGLIHRDIKPANILLNRRGHPLLADFGLAAAFSNSQSGSKMLREMPLSGTPLYMAPEQWEGFAGKASDIYALGVILYYMLAGELPFKGNQNALAHQHKEVPPPKLAERNPGRSYPPRLDELLAQLLAKRPAERPRTATEIARRFRAILEDAERYVAQIAQLLDQLKKAEKNEEQEQIIAAIEPPIRPFAREKLVSLLKAPQAFPPSERAIYGRALSLLGDPRPGVGTWKQRVGGRDLELPQIEWCDIPVPPNGKFVMGSSTWSNNPRREVALGYSFRMAKYPITYRQYQTFIDSGEYNTSIWWKDFPEKYQRQPSYEQEFKYANHPRDTISWFQAVAFTRWLDAKYREAGLLVKGAEIRLPMEEEWEYAARGTDERTYPYGDAFDVTKGNTYESGIGMTSAVGCFPEGASPFGVLELSGNVWEWCLNEYDNPKALINFNSTNSRVLRGGAFYDDAFGAASAARNGNLPSNGNSRFGFRVVVFPPIRASDL
ncbi:MAG: SUMF1/EgtB/PvdO family nonheme iron enzyme [Chloroflexi bacterium]|nr:SUMF1/EgtB/PvdO family nonheme iron enzyme [Chloroflexota bacterium]